MWNIYKRLDRIEDEAQQWRRYMVDKIADLEAAYEEVKSFINMQSKQIAELTAELEAAHAADDTDAIEAVVAKFKDLAASAAVAVKDPAAPANPA
jgi:predicted  nucleic acid-binding Zn-ribbon protein